MIDMLMPLPTDVLPIARTIRNTLDQPLSLRALARRAGRSPFHLQRVFRLVTGESPKQYALRLRIERAAAALASSDASILGAALANGFASHEVFVRAFRRLLGKPPSRYRRRALGDAMPQARRLHRVLVESAGPCIGLFHLSTTPTLRSSPMATLSIARQDLTDQPVVFVRVRAARHEIPAAIAGGLGKAFPFAMKAGLPIAGRPYARYHAMGPGLFTMDVGVPVGASTAGEGEVEGGTLPGGPALLAVHAGSYDSLGETYAAMERWMEEHGCQPNGGPWESYITDPAEHPDPAEWRTEVYWPIAP
jgi:AraC family transcriptional regulator